MVQSSWYWPKLLLRNWYGVTLLGIIVFASIDAIVHGTKVNWRGLGIVWAVIAAIVAWSAYNSKRTIAKENAKLDATLPDWIILTSGGLEFDGPKGATAFQPWANYKAWREKGRVILLDRSEGSGFTMLPIAALSDGERQSLRAMLNSSIPTFRP